VISPRRYIRSYLDGKGAAVPGAGIVSKRPQRMAPASDVSRLLRRSFEAQAAKPNSREQVARVARRVLGRPRHRPCR
jgi:hypothetical protein